jgi:Kazal-type serine protease inhibitor domain
MTMLSNRFHFLTLTTFALLALPAAKGGCGPGVDIGQDDGTCGGIQGLTCGANEFCDWPDDSCGTADQLGVCTPVPQACNDIYQPVCGCDGLTYGNDCEASTAGVSVASAGECGGTGGNGGGGGAGGGGGEEMCGGIQGLPCGVGEFCDWQDSSCGIADQLGVCTSMPEECDQQYDPVCGCDGQTYGNDCSANAAGISVAASGECGSSAQDCGGLGGLMCPGGEFCDWQDMSCGIADQLGTCASLPQVCPDIFQPVCGCDAQTYGNACEANTAGMSVASSGPC